MYLISSKVPQIKLINCLYAIYLTSAFCTIGVLCSENVGATGGGGGVGGTTDTYTNHLKKIPHSGSGAGAGGTASSLQKRSSYQVISQTMSEALLGNNEFGSEYEFDFPKLVRPTLFNFKN